MVDIPVSTITDKPVTVSVTIEKFEADLVCFDDRNDRLAINVNWVDTDPDPDEIVKTQLIVISGQSYIDLVTQPVNGSQNFAQNLIAGVTSILQDVAAGNIPAEDLKIIDVDFFQLLGQFA